MKALLLLQNQHDSACCYIVNTVACAIAQQSPLALPFVALMHKLRGPNKNREYPKPAEDPF